MNKHFIIFLNVILLISLGGIYGGQALSMQQVGKMSKNGHAHFEMSRQYTTSYETTSPRIKVLMECEKLSGKMAKLMARNNQKAPQADDIELKVQDDLIHAVRPENFECIKIYHSINCQFIIFKDLIKTVNQGKTYSAHRIGDIDKSIHHNYSKFHDLVGILKRDNKCVDQELINNMEKMCSDSVILLGWINTHSNAHTNKSNIE